MFQFGRCTILGVLIPPNCYELKVWGLSGVSFTWPLCKPEANINGAEVTLRPVFCGVKGDWPFLRKVYKLKTGFQDRVLRKCHYCACPETLTLLDLSSSLFFTNKFSTQLPPKLVQCAVGHSNIPAGKDWWDFTSTSELRNLPLDYVNPSPYKANVRSPVFDLPGGECPSRIRADPAHTYHIGYGKDENASIVILLCNAGHFGPGSLPTKLDNAFERFAIYCKSNGKHTSITEFSKKLFKIQQGCLV